MLPTLAAQRRQCVCLYVCAYMCVLICVCLYVCAYMCVLICVCLYVCAYMCVLICVCLYVCAYMCVLTCVCLYVRAMLRSASSIEVSDFVEAASWRITAGGLSFYLPSGFAVNQLLDADDEVHKPCDASWRVDEVMAAWWGDVAEGRRG